MKLTKKEARRFMLLHLNLLNGKTLKGKKGIMSYVEKVGCLQFDPLNIIAMNPHLVLQSRIKHYKMKMLNDLLYKDRLLMDGWDKNMAIYPIVDRPYFYRYYDSAIETHTWRDPDIVKFIPQVRQALNEGPQSSKSIAISHKVDWSWAPTSASRALLDLMFFTGELIVYNKEKGRKIYDYSKNHLSEELLNTPDPNPKDTDYFKWGILRRIKALGILWDRASEAYLGIKNLKSANRQKAYQELLEEGLIKKITIEDSPYDYYISNDTEYLVDDINKSYRKRVSFIAPLDNLIWDRKLIKELFDFEYKWEVYTPEKDRKYGYYVLPILYGDTFIGRIEPVFEKKSKTLFIKGLWIDKIPEKSFKKALEEFADFLGATSITYGDKTPDTLNKLENIMKSC